MAKPFLQDCNHSFSLKWNQNSKTEKKKAISDLFGDWMFEFCFCVCASNFYNVTSNFFNNTDMHVKRPQICSFRRRPGPMASRARILVVAVVLTKQRIIACNFYTYRHLSGRFFCFPILFFFCIQGTLLVRS